MTEQKGGTGWTPDRALIAIDGARRGLSYAQIADLVAATGWRPTRSGVAGFFFRLEREREDDARDLRILDQLAGGTMTAEQVARKFDVSVDHVRTLRLEAKP